MLLMEVLHTVDSLDAFNKAGALFRRDRLHVALHGDRGGRLFRTIRANRGLYGGYRDRVYAFTEPAHGKPPPVMYRFSENESWAGHPYWNWRSGGREMLGPQLRYRAAA